MRKIEQIITRIDNRVDKLFGSLFTKIFRYFSLCLSIIVISVLCFFAYKFLAYRFLQRIPSVALQVDHNVATPDSIAGKKKVTIEKANHLLNEFNQAMPFAKNDECEMTV